MAKEKVKRPKMTRYTFKDFENDFPTGSRCMSREYAFRYNRRHDTTPMFESILKQVEKYQLAPHYRG